MNIGAQSHSRQKKQNRALFVLPTDVMGGAERVCMTLAEEVAKSNVFSNIDVYILSRKPSGSLEHFSRYKNVKIIYSKLPRETLGAVVFTGFVVRHSYDFVFSTHIHINALCCLLRRLKILRTQRLVTRESTTLTDRPDFGFVKHALRGLHKVYGSQDLIICQTERMLAAFNKETKNLLRNKTVVVFNPIDLERVSSAIACSPRRQALNLPEDGVKIVWCGRFIDVKAPKRAVETLYEIHRGGHTSFHLVMVGDGPLLEETKEHAKTRGLECFITFTGQTTNPLAIMAKCDFGLVTSEVEGFPNVILEMLACGVKATVTTDCTGGLEDIPGVFISNSISAKSLANCFLPVRELTDATIIARHIQARSAHAFFAQMGTSQ